jgi:DNA-binding response OmpR family regulator
VSAGNPCKILIVDDEQAIADGLALYGSKLGYECRVAYTGPDAVAAAKADPPDLMLLDIALPGLDGRDVMNALNEAGITKHTIVIFVTARDSQSDRLLGLELGAKDYETKPLHFGLLFRKIGYLLDQRG